MKKILYLFLCFMPLAAAAQAPTGAVFSLEKKQYVFDTLEWGQACQHDFIFTNTGDEPLVITHVSNTCSCAMASWDTEPVLPGKTGRIHYKYDSTRPGPFTKTTHVYGNFYGSPLILVVKGFIQPRPGGSPSLKVSSNP